LDRINGIKRIGERQEKYRFRPENMRRRNMKKAD
jgi:hypothetical protein